jgi:hypothetical protein
MSAFSIFNVVSALCLSSSIEVPIRPSLTSLVRAFTVRLLTPYTHARLSLFCSAALCCSVSLGSRCSVLLLCAALHRSAFVGLFCRSVLLCIARLSLACSAAPCCSASLGSLCSVLLLCAAVHRLALVGLFCCSVLLCIARLSLACSAALCCSASLGSRWPVLLLCAALHHSALVGLFCCSVLLCSALLCIPGSLAFALAVVAVDLTVSHQPFWRFSRLPFRISELDTGCLLQVN